MEAVKASLLQQSGVVNPAEELKELARKHPRRKGQSERDYHDMLRDLQRRRENKRRERAAAAAPHASRRARSVDRYDGYDDRRRGRKSNVVSGHQEDIIAQLAERYEQRHAHAHTSGGGGGRSRSQNRGNSKLNASSYW
jgi:hypothetical protein